MYIDLFLGIFVLLGVIQGYSRGILRTLFSIAGIVLGFIAALKFSPLIVEGIDKVFNIDPRLSLILGFLLTLALIIWGIQWLGKGLEKTLRAVNLNFLNKLAGSIAFAALMIVIYAAIIWFLSKTEFLSDSQKADSQTYPYLMEVPLYAEEAFESVKPIFHEFWDKMESALEERE